jgi:hypothetical protein
VLIEEEEEGGEMGSMVQGERGQGGNMVVAVCMLKMSRDAKQEVTSHIRTRSTQWMRMGSDSKQGTTPYTLQTKCWNKQWWPHTHC